MYKYLDFSGEKYLILENVSTNNIRLYWFIETARSYLSTAHENLTVYQLITYSDLNIANIGA